jgi:hypothetical protein
MKHADAKLAHAAVATLSGMMGGSQCVARSGLGMSVARIQGASDTHGTAVWPIKTLIPLEEEGADRAYPHRLRSYVEQISMRDPEARSQDQDQSEISDGRAPEACRSCSLLLVVLCLCQPRHFCLSPWNCNPEP